MNKILNKLFTFLLIVYYILSMLFPYNDVKYFAADESNRILPQITMALIGILCIGVSIFNFKQIECNKIIRPFLYLSLIAFIYIFWINTNYSLFKNFIGFLKYYMAILVMFMLYLNLIKYPQETKHNIFIVYGIQLIYVFQCLIVDRYLYQSNNDVFNSNSGFLMLACIPMSLILPNKRFRLYIYTAVVVGCLFSGQRSASLAALISFPFCWVHLRECFKRRDKIIFFILCFLVLYPIIQISINNLILRTEIDASMNTIGSGRSTFWKLVWESYCNNDLLFQIVGCGMGSVQNYLKETYGMAITAHNGWLDHLYVYGILGFIFYSYSLFCILKNNKLINNYLIDYKNILFIIFLLFFIKCSTSHGNWDISVIPLTSVLAIIAAEYNINLHKKNDYKQ